MKRAFAVILIFAFTKVFLAQTLIERELPLKESHELVFNQFGGPSYKDNGSIYKVGKSNIGNDEFMGLLVYDPEEIFGKYVTLVPESAQLYIHWAQDWSITNWIYTEMSDYTFGQGTQAQITELLKRSGQLYSNTAQVTRPVANYDDGKIIVGFICQANTTGYNTYGESKLTVKVYSYNVNVTLITDNGSLSGSLLIDGQSQTVPYSTTKYNGNIITLTVDKNVTYPGPQGSNMVYAFDHWVTNSTNNNSTNATITEAIYGNKTISAYYKLVKEKITVYVKNNFGGGKIKAQVSSAPTSNSDSPVTIYDEVDKTLYMQAVEGAEQPVYQNYARVWNDTEGTLNKSNWEKRDNNNVSKGFFSSNASASLTLSSAEKNYSYVADLKKLYNVTFSGNSSVYVNYTLYPSPATSQVVEQNSVTASAVSYSSNNVNFSFDSWKKDGVIYSANITPSDHGTYNAVYRAKPSNSGENVHFGTVVGRAIVIYWTDNPNPNVTQYQIWRRVKHNGVTGPETLVRTVNSGVQSYTDYDYALTSTYSDDLLWYDVRAYYNSTDPYIIGDYSDASYTAVYGKEFAKMNENALAQEAAEEIPTEYSIGNFPNPFNPATTIKYGLPEAGFVTLKVYDILGREVAELVNETKSAGYYEVSFDASKLTSGVYIYTISAGKYTESKKMILTK